MLVLHFARGLAVLDSRKRLLGGAVIAVVGLGTALFFRKPPTEPPGVSWPSGFTEVQPSSPFANPTPPEPVQPRLAGRIESLADASTTPATGSLYQLPGSSPHSAASNQPSVGNAPADPFLRAASAAALPSNTADLNVETDAAPAKVDALSELTPLVPDTTTTNTLPVEHSTGYRWSPNRSNLVDPPANTAQPVNTALAERPALMAPPPMSALPGLAPPLTLSAANTPAPRSEPPSSAATPSLALPTYGFAPAAAPAASPPAATFAAPLASGAVVRHRIEDGDTLASIARRYYGDEQQARQVFEANRHVLRDPEILPIGYELTLPGGSPNNGIANPPAAMPMSPAVPMSQAIPQFPVVPPLLTPPAIEQFGPRTLAVSNSSWRGANDPAVLPAAAPLAPVALSPWDQQLANAAPLAPSASPAFPAVPVLVNPPPAPSGWPAAPAGTVTGNTAPPQVGWPPRPAAAAQNWPTRAWNSSESALNWVGDKVLGTGSSTVPQAGSKTYLVKPLETWETLAQRFYGDPRQAAMLYSANPQLPAGTKIRPGTVINVPNMPL